MRKVKLASALLAIVLLFGACAEDKPGSEGTHLALNEYGPTETTAGKPFNVQPDGGSALWAATENATPTTVLVFKDTVLESSVQGDGKFVTAGVPQSLYQQAGEYPVFLLDQKTQEKSNEMKFIVR